jgi:hypothetical protein
MDIASAYPNSDLSALSMTVIAVVVVCTLAAWLGLVFLAARPPHGKRNQAGQAEAEAAQPQRPGRPGQPALADNDHSELDQRHPAEHPGVAA